MLSQQIDLCCVQFRELSKIDFMELLIEICSRWGMNWGLLDQCFTFLTQQIPLRIFS